MRSILLLTVLMLAGCGAVRARPASDQGSQADGVTLRLKLDKQQSVTYEAQGSAQFECTPVLRPKDPRVTTSWLLTIEQTAAQQGAGWTVVSLATDDRTGNHLTKETLQVDGRSFAHRADGLRSDFNGVLLPTGPVEIGDRWMTPTMDLPVGKLLQMVVPEEFTVPVQLAARLLQVHEGVATIAYGATIRAIEYHHAAERLSGVAYYKGSANVDIATGQALRSEVRITINAKASSGGQQGWINVKVVSSLQRKG